MKPKIKKGDEVLVAAGKDKGKKGKVLSVNPKDGVLVVEGVNIHKRHVKPRRQGEKGQIVEQAFPLHISAVRMVCSKCGKATRVGYHMEGEKKVRICKHCKGEV